MARGNDPFYRAKGYQSMLAPAKPSEITHSSSVAWKYPPSSMILRQVERYVNHKEEGNAQDKEEMSNKEELISHSANRSERYNTQDSECSHRKKACLHPSVVKSSVALQPTMRNIINVRI